MQIAKTQQTLQPDVSASARIIKKVFIPFVLNLVLLIGTILLLADIAQKAEGIKRGRSLKLRATDTNIKVIEIDLEEHRKDAEKLASLFPDDTELINFVKEIDQLKKEGTIISFSFASEGVVKDKTSYSGLPVIIEFKGSREKVDEVLRKVQSLPFLLRAITVEIRRLPENSITLKYGGFLYVDEKFNQN